MPHFAPLGTQNKVTRSSEPGQHGPKWLSLAFVQPFSGVIRYYPGPPLPNACSFQGFSCCRRRRDPEPGTETNRVV